MKFNEEHIRFMRSKSDKLSAAQMSIAFNIKFKTNTTRNSIIGQCYRRGIKLESIPVYVKRSIKIKNVIQNSKKSMIDVKEFECREIIGEPSSFTCCGAPIEKGSYCKNHARINYK